MSRYYSILIKVAIASVVLFSILSNSLIFLRGSSSITGKDVEGLYWKRYYELKRNLPSDAVLGYVSDKKIRNIFIKNNKVKVFPDKNDRTKPVDAVNEYDMRAISGFWMTENILVPHALFLRTDLKYIVGNFSSTKIDYRDYVSDSYKFVGDYGNGLMLFEEISE